jgi:hypothetical protein
MDVNRSLNHGALQAFTADNDRLSVAGGASPGKNLGERVIELSKNMLARIMIHGTLQEKQMASCAHAALEAGKFIHNPAALLPVYQYGKLSMIDEREGVLLANLMPHGEMLELMALGFREKGHLFHDNGSVRVIVLSHAKDFPQPRLLPPRDGNNIASSSNPKSPSRPVLLRSESDNLTIGSEKPGFITKVLELTITNTPNSELEKARRLMQWESIKFRLTPMYLQMAHSLAARRIKEGQVKGEKISNWSAVPSAHLELIKAMIYHPKDKYQRGAEPYKPPEKLEEKKIPKGVHYEFSKEAFALFYDEFLVREEAD